MNHPNVLSTTPRLGSTTNPFCPTGFRIVRTSHPHVPFTQPRSAPAYPPSAQITRSLGNRPRAARRTSLAPSRSCLLAGVTTTANSSPSTSTRMCLLRPLIFFSRVVPPDSRVVGGLDRLAVQRRGAGLGRPAVSEPHLVAEPVVQGLPDAVELPAADLGVDGLPGREVVRQHAPGDAAAQQVEVGIEDRTPGRGAGAAALLVRGEQGLGQLPLLIRQVTGVSFPVHRRTL